MLEKRCKNQGLYGWSDPLPGLPGKYRWLGGKKSTKKKWKVPDPDIDKLKTIGYTWIVLPILREMEESTRRIRAEEKTAGDVSRGSKFARKANGKEIVYGP